MSKAWQTFCFVEIWCFLFIMYSCILFLTHAWVSFYPVYIYMYKSTFFFFPTGIFLRTMHAHARMWDMCGGERTGRCVWSKKEKWLKKKKAIFFKLGNFLASTATVGCTRRIHKCTYLAHEFTLFMYTFLQLSIIVITYLLAAVPACAPQTQFKHNITSLKSSSTRHKTPSPIIRSNPTHPSLIVMHYSQIAIAEVAGSWCQRYLQVNKGWW